MSSTHVDAGHALPEVTELADSYLDNWIPDQAEFLEFRSRFAAAIMLFAASTDASERLAVEVERSATEAALLTDYRAEAEILVAEYSDQVEHFRAVGACAAIISATSAVELLISDLLPETGAASTDRLSRAGLHRKLTTLLSRWALNAPDTDELLLLATRITGRRNTLAHELTGSYWRPHQIDLSDAGVDTAFKDVGALAQKLSCFRSLAVSPNRQPT